MTLVLDCPYGRQLFSTLIYPWASRSLFLIVSYPHPAHTDTQLHTSHSSIVVFQLHLCYPQQMHKMWMVVLNTWQGVWVVVSSTCSHAPAPCILWCCFREYWCGTREAMTNVTAVWSSCEDMHRLYTGYSERQATPILHVWPALFSNLSTFS